MAEKRLIDGLKNTTYSHSQFLGLIIPEEEIMATVRGTARTESLSDRVERRVTRYRELRFCYGVYITVVGTLVGVAAGLMLFAHPVSKQLFLWHIVLVMLGSGVAGGFLFYRYIIRARLREEREFLNREVLDDLVYAGDEDRLLFGMRSAHTRYGGLIDEALHGARDLQSHDMPSRSIH